MPECKQKGVQSVNKGLGHNHKEHHHIRWVERKRKKTKETKSEILET